MIAVVAAGAISLWVSACIDGTLHGAPQSLCHEFQIRTYSGPDAIDTCLKARDQAVKDWIGGVQWLGAHLVGSRCGPGEAEGDDI